MFQGWGGGILSGRVECSRNGAVVSFRKGGVV